MSEKPLFREKAVQRVSTPDQLTDYLHVTNPGVWIVLVTVIVLLCGLFAWAAIGDLESTAEVNIHVNDQMAEVYVVGSKAIEIKKDMVVRVEDREFRVQQVGRDEDGWLVGYFETDLEEGVYNGTLVMDSVKPIGFLLESR